MGQARFSRLRQQNRPASRSFLGTALASVCFGVLGLGIPAQAQVLHAWSIADDACLTLAVLPDITGDERPEIVAGFDSGRVFCFGTDPTSSSLPLWSATLQGPVLALLPLPGTLSDPSPRLVASTNYGWVTCLHAGGPLAGSEVWAEQLPAKCGINALASYPDRDADGIDEIIAGGADQRVHLLNAATGAEFWNRSLTAGASGGGYVQVVVNAGDLNSDGTSDILVLTWESRKLFGLNGVNGSNLWTPLSGSNYTDPMVAAGDLNGDGRLDVLLGGNDRRMNLCSGANGSVIWYRDFQRPLRAVLVTNDVDGDAKTDCFGADAGGEIACVSGAGSGSRTALWTARVDDVCRSLTSPGDLNADGKPDVVVSTESGSVTAFSGTTGGQLWHWNAGDVVRVLVSLPDLDNDGVGEIAAASIDGTVSLLSGNPSQGTANPAPGTLPPLPVPVRAPTVVPAALPAPPPPAVGAAAASEVPILLYHDILPEMNYTYGASLDNFRAQMDLLVTGGYTCVSLDTIADWIEGKTELPDKPICITFDGPYDGQFTYALPVLRDRGLSATVYCTSDWIGTANHTDWHQMRFMDGSGIQNIQNHTMYHANLTTLTQDGVTSQVVVCSNSIQRHLNGKVSVHHAYPGGAYSTTVMEYLRALGFRTATTVVNRPVVRTDDLMALPRRSVVRSTTIDQFKALIGYQEPTPTPTPSPTETATPTVTPSPSPTPPVSGVTAWLLY